MIKKIWLFFLMHPVMALSATLEEDLSHLIGMVEALDQFVAQLPKIEEPIIPIVPVKPKKSATEIKLELESLITSNGLRDFDEIGKRKLDLTIFNKSKKLLTQLKELNEDEFVNNYSYILGRAHLEYINRRLLERFLSAVKRKDFLVVEENLKTTAQAVAQEYPAQADKSWQEQLRYLIRVMRELLDFLKPVLPSGKQAVAGFDLLQENSKAFSKEIAVYIRTGFTQYDPIQYKNDGKRDDIFSQDEMNLFKSAVVLLQHNARAEDEDFLKNYSSLVGEMEKWIGKKPVRGGALSIKEILLSAFEKEHQVPSQKDKDQFEKELEEQAKKIQEELQKEKNNPALTCQEQKNIIIKIAGLLEKQAEDNIPLGDNLVRELADHIERYKKILKCEYDNDVLRALEDLIAVEKRRYFKEKDKTKLYNKLKAGDMRKILIYYLNSPEEVDSSVGNFSVSLKAVFGLK